MGSLWEWALRSEPKYRDSDTPTVVATLECWQYDGESPETDVKERVEDLLEDWANAASPLKNGKQPSCGLKLILITQPYNYGISLSRENVNVITKAFRLPPAYLHCCTNLQGGCGMFVEADGNYVIIHSKANGTRLRSTVLRYDPVKNLSLGYILTGCADEDLVSAKSIIEQFLQCSHPLLLPTLMIEASSRIATTYLSPIDTVLCGVEAETGFGRWKDRPTQDHTSSKDYQPLVRKLGEQYTACSTIVARLWSFRASTAAFRQKLDDMNSTLPEVRKCQMRQQSVQLQARMDFLASSLEHASFLYDSFQRRLDAQQSVLFNLIAQADNQVNLGLAKDSKELAAAAKQDSSAMKIIAVLTTLFLPGTFLATFFAMPLFNWADPSITNVAGPHFWLYWAVTGPVTLVTALMVGFWALAHNRDMKLLYERARNSIQGVSSADEQVEGKVLDASLWGNGFNLPKIFRRRKLEKGPNA